MAMRISSAAPRPATPRSSSRAERRNMGRRTDKGGPPAAKGRYQPRRSRQGEGKVELVGVQGGLERSLRRCPFACAPGLVVAAPASRRKTLEPSKSTVRYLVVVMA